MKKCERCLPVIASILQLEALEISDLCCPIVPDGEPPAEDDYDKKREEPVAQSLCSSNSAALKLGVGSHLCDTIN